MRALAADDDVGVARLLSHCLARWGYEPIIAHDGHEAWLTLKQEDAPRIAILDWDMPGLTGLEVCRLLRATPHGKRIYVLMLTARQHKNDLIEALEAGADDFLSKPFHPRELQLRLAKGMRDAARDAPPRDRVTSAIPPSATTLGGKYRLERKIAEGGMATVWLGVHLALGINVAIKFMAPKLAEQADYASFEREARAAAQLRNPNVVRVYDHGITDEGLPYLVMEYIAGEALSSRIARLGPMTPPEVASLVDRLARVLDEIHARGLVHRDVKPENVLVLDAADAPEGFEVKLVDFGLAKARGGPSDAVFVQGTPSYMSPESLTGAPPGPLADLWALAATAFMALTGTLPFGGGVLDEVVKHVRAAPLPVPSAVNPRLSPEVDAWFARACARAPDERFQTPSELAAALASACKTSIGPPPPTAFGKERGEKGLAATEPDLKLPLDAPKRGPT
jgi:serine/threonine protein kinase/CheY-like chemotaxis protein